MSNEITFKEKGGITLIALIVTIVILIILAGISINMLTGQNGILNRSNEAKQNTRTAQTEELVNLSVIEAISQGLGNLTAANLEVALNNNIGAGNYELQESNGGYTITINQKNFWINEKGQVLPVSAEGQNADTQIKNPESYGKNPNAQATADGAGKYFAKPDGATYVTGTVDTGVVVNIKESEFVWVPVDDVVLDTNKDADLPKSNEAGTSSGKIYTPMAIQVGNDYKGILYEFSGSNSYLKYAGNSNYQGGESDYREPYILSYDNGDYKSYGITTETLTLEYNAMIESISKYKGFYVARYEAGLDKTTNKIIFKNASIETNNVITTDANNQETYRWYGLYKKIKTFTTDSDKIVSSMIWGSQYNAMMNWMLKTGKAVGIADNKRKNTEMVTGKNEKDVINNIFDLYGCHREWTIETCGRYNRSVFGGDGGCELAPSACTSNNVTDTNSSRSSRATLYIK